jgi:hypothetical protein
MHRASTLRSYLAELVVVFVGVALAFAVDNFREAHNERTAGDRRIENGLRLIVVNLDLDHESLLPLLESAKVQVEQLLQQIPAR